MVEDGGGGTQEAAAGGGAESGSNQNCRHRYDVDLQGGACLSCGRQHNDPLSGAHVQRKNNRGG